MSFKKFVNQARSYMPSKYRDGIAQTTKLQRTVSNAIEFITAPQVRSVFPTLREAQESYTALKQSPNFFSRARFVGAIGSVLYECTNISMTANDKYVWLYLSEPGWTNFELEPLMQYVVNLIIQEARLQGDSCSITKLCFAREENSVLFETSFNGATFRWAENTGRPLGESLSPPKSETSANDLKPGKHVATSLLYLDLDDSEQSIKVIRDLVQKSNYEHSLIEPVRFGSMMHERDRSRLSFVRDDSFVKGKPSAVSESLSERLGRFRSKGIRRSFMLYGPPGTGKTTAILQACKGIRTLRINAKDFAELEYSFWAFISQYVCPEAIIIDDIDRMENISRHLETFELINEQIPFFLTTANHISRLDSAVLRPGRFDELIEVKSLDEKSIRALFGDSAEAERHFELVKSWPVAWIHEFAKRLKYYGEEQALLDIQDLQLRLDEISRGYGVQFDADNAEDE